MFYIENLPRIGTNDEYVNKINSYFELIDAHDHKNIGNFVQASSINFTYLYLFNSIVNVDLTSFYDFNNFTEINTYTTDTFLFVSNLDLYYRKLNQTIRLTQNGALNVNVSDTGIKGDYNLYGIKTDYNSILQKYSFSSNKGVSDLLCKFSTFNIVLATSNINQTGSKAIIQNKPTFEFLQDFGYATINQNKAFEFSNRVIDTQNYFSEYFIFNDSVNILQSVFNRPTVTEEVGNAIHYTDSYIGDSYALYYNSYLQFPYVSYGDQELYYHVMGNTSTNMATPSELSLTLAKGSNTVVYSPKPFDGQNTGSYLYFLNAKTALQTVQNYSDFMFINGDLYNPLARSYIVNKIFMESSETLTQKCIFAYYKP